MSNVLKSMRLHIGILGKRNVGKSSLLNFMAGQNTSIVSDVAGTTTDTVEKIMELLPVGPVVFLDTAGIDDVGELGEQRIEKTFDAFNRLDVALIVCDYNGIDEFEYKIADELKKRNIPFGILVNKNDVAQISSENKAKIDELSSNNLVINTIDESYKTSIIQITF